MRKVVSVAFIFFIATYAFLAHSSSVGGSISPIGMMVFALGGDDRPIIKLVLKNNTKEKYYLYKYNFCLKGVLSDNLFKIVGDGPEKVVASYGGIVDLQNQANAKESDFIAIESGAEISCEVDIKHYYYFPVSGEYNLTFSAKNLEYKDQNELLIVSQTIPLKVVKRLPVK